MENFKDSLTNTGNKIKKFFIKFFTIVLLMGAAAFAFFYFTSYSDGVRAGIVLKLSKRGVLFKTWEGQMDVDAFGAVTDRSGGNNMLKQSFEFSVDGDETQVISDLQAVALSGERVNLHYEEKYFKIFWRGETNTFINKVERLGSK